MAQKITASQIDGNDYSSAEVNTGRKWTNGKDIYRKVVTFDRGTGSTYNISIGSGIETITEYMCYLRDASTDGARFISVPYIGASFNDVASMYRNAADTFNIYVGSTYASTWRYGILTLEYTKT